MEKLFGTNGVRGVFGKDFNLQFIHDLTLSIATFFKNGPLLIGYDGRDSSPIIANVVISALNYAGLDCKDVGLVPTPCLEYAVKKLRYTGGIMITASHNPPQYNGIKLVASDGIEISRQDEQKIEDIYFQKRWLGAAKLWGTSITQPHDIISKYLDGILLHVDTVRIRQREFKVALDLGNGAQIVAAPLLCKNLNCKITLVNDTLDGSFPGRGSEPTPENLDALSQAVIKNNADFGIAFDGDGDRSLLCDEKGVILSGDKSALLLAKFLITKYPNSDIVTCLNSGNAIDDIAKQVDARVTRTKVGSVEVSRKMAQIDALIGFEENGGFMYGRHNKVRDGAMTMGLVLDILSNTQKTISQLISKLPPSFTFKTKIPCTPSQAETIIKDLKSEFLDADTTDGIKISLGGKNWVMIRPSGTEPIARIYAEADSEESLQKIVSEYLQKTKSILLK